MVCFAKLGKRYIPSQCYIPKERTATICSYTRKLIYHNLFESLSKLKFMDNFCSAISMKIGKEGTIK
jgi:hypothetical protein